MKEHAHLLGKLKLQSIFQRIPGVVYAVFIPFMLFGPMVAPTLFAAYMVFLNVFFILNAFRTFLGSYSAYYGAVEHSRTNWKELYSRKTGLSITDTRHDLPYDAVRHTIIIPQYKEDFETICETLDVLASHHMALSNYKVLEFNVDLFGYGRSREGGTSKGKRLDLKIPGSV
jgi:hypothetical protein